MEAKKSLVWQFFKSEDDGKSVRCNSCGKSIKRSNGNTSNLTGHLERAHRQQHQQLREMEQRKKMEKQEAEQVCITAVSHHFINAR